MALTKNNTKTTHRQRSRYVRLPSVAGQFYPSQVSQLYKEIQKHLSSDTSRDLKPAHAILVPHAGLIYSGDVAAASFREVDPTFERVFLVAANHNGYVPFSGISIPDFSHYQIPGAEIPLDNICDDLLVNPLFTSKPQVHRNHMIEIELPFLMELKNHPDPVNFTIVPMIAGQLEPSQSENLAKMLADYADEQTLFIFSVDLSHFQADDQARRMDFESIEAILGRDLRALPDVVTDGNQVLMVMASLAKLKAWEPSYLMYRNSSEINGDRRRVVGYGAVAFTDPIQGNLTRDAEKSVLAFARDAITEKVFNNHTIGIIPGLLDKYPIFRNSRGVFVTLKIDGKLRGCIGHLTSWEPLHLEVLDCAIGSAINDPRFQPVEPNEVNKLKISISILDSPCLIHCDNPKDYPKLLRPGVDGVIMVRKGHRSTFLPQVWEDIRDPVDFLNKLSLKQGGSAEDWKDRETTLYRYTAYVFSED